MGITIIDLDEKHNCRRESRQLVLALRHDLHCTLQKIHLRSIGRQGAKDSLSPQTPCSPLFSPWQTNQNSSGWVGRIFRRNWWCSGSAGPNIGRSHGLEVMPMLQGQREIARLASVQRQSCCREFCNNATAWRELQRPDPVGRVTTPASPALTSIV